MNFVSGTNKCSKWNDKSEKNFSPEENTRKAEKCFYFKLINHEQPTESQNRLFISQIFFPAHDLSSDGKAPTIEPSGSFTTIEVSSDKIIECRAEKPVTWISEVCIKVEGKETKSQQNICRFSNLIMATSSLTPP